MYFGMPAPSLLAVERPGIAKDSSDGAEFAWNSGLKLLIVIFFVVFFLLYVLVLINGERRPADSRDRQETQPTSRMADPGPPKQPQQPQQPHHARSGGPAGSIADNGPAPAGEPGEPT